MSKKNPDERPDTHDILSCIKRQCDSDSFDIRMDRLTDFINSPDSYQSEELNELFTLYRYSALLAFKSQNIALGMRIFEQAEKLGPISPKDLKIKNSILKKHQYRYLTVFIAIISGLTIPAILIVNLFLTKQNNKFLKLKFNPIDTIASIFKKDDSFTSKTDSIA